MCQRFNGTEKRLDGGLVIVVPPPSVNWVKIHV